MESLVGKTALVTGAASGIGLATAELFAKRKAKVALNHLPDDPRGTAAVERLRAQGHAVIAAPGDVSRPGSAETMVHRAVDALGRLDFLVNNAGTPATVEPIPPADLDRLNEEFWPASSARTCSDRSAARAPPPPRSRQRTGLCAIRLRWQIGRAHV